MTKLEALKFLKQKLKDNYVTHLMLLELYDDDEEIPEDFLNLCYHKPKTPKPPELFISEKMWKFLDN